MEVIAYEMKYTKKSIENSKIECIPFSPEHFDAYKKIYNECFYEMRKALDIKPYDFLSAYDQIKDKISDIYLLLGHDEIIGSVACYENEIDDLIVNPKYQQQGYGKQLLIWAINRIRQNNDYEIILHVAEWNYRAVRMYENVGFTIEKKEKVR